MINVNVILFLTNKCTNECSYCFMNGSPKNNQYVSLEVVHQIIEKYKNENYKIISLGGGEPTLHPEIKTICKLLLDNSWQIVLHTNGNDYDFIDWLVNLYKESPLLLQIYQSFNNELFEKDLSLVSKIKDFVRSNKQLLEFSNIEFYLTSFIETFEKERTVTLLTELNKICHKVQLIPVHQYKFGRSKIGIEPNIADIKINIPVELYTSDGNCFENVFDSWKHELELSDDETSVNKSII